MRIGPDTIVRPVIAGGLLVLMLAALGVFDDRLPGRPLGVNRFQTPDITGERRIGQRFFLNKPNLNAIEIRPVAVGKVQGTVLLELRDIQGDSDVLVRREEVSATDFVRNETFRFEFPPIRDSRGHLYRLDIRSSPEAPTTGVALWATKGERFSDGFLSVNGKERFANLAYQVAMPPRRRVIPFALAALAVSWIAFVFVLRELAS